ncbi:MAG TPA: PfkB family carbohydrate kinase, partial [Spirochaetia bacterium]|nr:PfkB family carbohydrate kinase [Spirochaetia bacterium]
METPPLASVRQLDDLLSRVSRVRIGVVGDFCLDAYWTLDASLSEISIETGLATRPVSVQRYSLGGAGNVAANLAALGVAGVRAFGVVGDDPFGREMGRLLDAIHVDHAGVMVQGSRWDTPVYIKPVEGDSEQARIDFGNANALDAGVGARLIEALRQSLPGLDLVIVNQQLLHGVHTDQFRADLAALIPAARVPFICDSRSFNDDCPGASRKLNDREALRLVGAEWESSQPVPRHEAESALQTLFARWNATIFLTRGPRGLLVRDAGGLHEVPGLQILGRIDTVG